MDPRRRRPARVLVPSPKRIDPLGRSVKDQGKRGQARLESPAARHGPGVPKSMSLVVTLRHPPA